MRGLFKFIIFSTALIALLLLVGVPLVAGPLLSGIVRDAGLQGDDVQVSIDLMGPGLLAGRAPQIRIQADQVAVSHGVIGRLDLTLHNVSANGHSFESVSGRLEDVRVNGPGGVALVVGSVDLEGPAHATRAAGRIHAEDAVELVARVARQAGMAVDGVIFQQGLLTLTHGDEVTDAHLRVAGDALILERVGSEPQVVLAPAPSEPWRLEDVRITAEGLEIDLTIDANDLAERVRSPDG